MLSEGSSVKGSPEDKQPSGPCVKGSAKISRQVTLAHYTGHSLTICRSLLPGGCLLRWGVCSGGMSAPGGLLRGCLLQGVGCLLWGVSALGGGVCSSGGVCSRGWVSALGGVCSVGWGCLLPVGGVCSQGDVCSRGSAHRGGGIPACTEADIPRVNRMTDRCKILPWPQLRCRR